MHTAIEKLIRREITADQLGETAEAAMLEIVPPNGDSPLSEKGQEQARKLGEYWAPILDGRAGNGGVHFFVSPQIRCMRTASPLITQLFEKHGITAKVLPDLIEVPGLMQKEDQVAFYTAYEKLLSEGKKDEAAAFRQGFKWQACGENVEDLQKEFPWAVFDPKLFPATGPWYDKGWESLGEARERADRNVALLRSLQSKMRDGEVVVVVSHGAAMGNIISSLLETEVNSRQIVQFFTLHFDVMLPLFMINDALLLVDARVTLPTYSIPVYQHFISLIQISRAQPSVLSRGGGRRKRQTNR
jgi:broad specificity phosphatase PhoE